MINLLKKLFAACLLCCSVATASLSQGDWPGHIYVESIDFERVAKANNPSFDAICEMYELESQEFLDELDTMVVYCLYNDEKKPIGAIQIDVYDTFESLKLQVSDEKLAQLLFDHGITLELSYGLVEQYRGQGIGSKSIKAWVEKVQSDGLFAVVDADNIASMKVLERSGFHYIGSYVHTKTQKNTHLYIKKAI